MSVDILKKVERAELMQDPRHPPISGRTESADTVSLPRGAGEGRGTACCGQRVVLSDGGDELPVRSMTACI